jgi:hypothetical protein
MIREAYKEFLLDRLHTDAVRHSGRSLYTHLAGTHDLLQEWGNPMHICNAGLFHSIYGTVRFRHKAWPLDLRNTIMELIGPEAELLVYLFCVTDRPRAIIESRGSLFNKHKNETVMLAPLTLRSLREIEAANLLEQGSHVGHLLQALAPLVSEGARSAIELRRRNVAAE